MAKLKSRRLIAKKEDVEEKKEELVYCRKCKENKKTSEFHSALDNFLDSNGFFSVCKSCIDNIFNGFMNSSMNDINESIYKTCKVLNVLYVEKVVESVRLHISKSEEKERTYKIFSLYKSHLGRHLSLNQGVLGTFVESPVIFSKGDTVDSIENETTEFKDYLKIFWGNGLSVEDYNYLESELGRWKKTHSCSNAAEETLLREVCFTQLEIRKSRLEGNDPSTLIKRLQDLMKTANLASPVAASQSQDVFGVWIKEIETKTPAEWWEDNRIFKDVDGLMVYINDFIVRPIRNFIMSTRDFKISEEIGVEDDDINEELGDDLEDGIETEVK